MFGSIRRPRASLAGVRFGDSCAEASTPAQRTERRYAAVRATTYPLTSPR
jgi:hypothetical protein